MKRGEIRWYTFRLPDKRRPVLVLTRNDVIDRLNEIIVVPATRTIRGLTSEVVLTADDGTEDRIPTLTSRLLKNSSRLLGHKLTLRLEALYAITEPPVYISLPPISSFAGVQKGFSAAC